MITKRQPGLEGLSVLPDTTKKRRRKSEVHKEEFHKYLEIWKTKM